MPRFLAARPNAELITLPWDIPLADWPEENLVALPRGISRHVVRFVEYDGTFYALKEINHDLAHREYRLLRALAQQQGGPGNSAPAEVGQDHAAQRPALQVRALEQRVEDRTRELADAVLEAAGGRPRESHGRP
jgi:hypothetical protein